MGHIYFIGNEHGAIKIGYTSVAPRRRLHQLQIANADRLTFLGILRGGIKDEAKLHDRFSHLRIRGEWFEAIGSLLDYIRSLEEADLRKIEDWQQSILPRENTVREQGLVALSKAKAEANRIVEDARRAANEIISESIDLIRKYAAIEIRELTSSSLSPLLFDHRCCQCGQACSTVKERDDGLPWCNVCWVNHSIFDGGRFDGIVARVSEEAQALVGAEANP